MGLSRVPWATETAYVCFFVFFFFFLPAQILDQAEPLPSLPASFGSPSALGFSFLMSTYFYWESDSL